MESLEASPKGGRMRRCGPCQATPFNTLLWRVVGVDGNHYFEGYWSLLSPAKGLSLAQHTHDPGLLVGIEEAPAVQRLN